MPAAAGDIGHAVAKASNAARSAVVDTPTAAVAAAADAPATVTASGAVAAGAQVAGDAPAAAAGGASSTGRRGSSAASRSALATVLLGCLGLLSAGSALLVRHSWHNPAMSVIAVILALLLGIGGVFYVCLSAALFAGSARVSRQRKLAG
jgi:hypothetical protein